MSSPAILYISGPMRGLPLFNYLAFHQAARTLREAGYAVVNPADFGRVDGWPWVEYLKRDLRLMLSAGPNLYGIATLPDAPLLDPQLPPSSGLALETHVGRSLGLYVRDVTTWLEIGSSLVGESTLGYRYISIQELDDVKSLV